MACVEGPEPFQERGPSAPAVILMGASGWVGWLIGSGAVRHEGGETWHFDLRADGESKRPARTAWPYGRMGAFGARCTVFPKTGGFGAVGGTSAMAAAACRVACC